MGTESRKFANDAERRAYAARVAKSMGGIDYRKMPPAYFGTQIARMEAEESGDEQKRLHAIAEATRLIARGS
jgi:hypothetical protein